MSLNNYVRRGSDLCPHSRSKETVHQKEEKAKRKGKEKANSEQNAREGFSKTDRAG